MSKFESQLQEWAMGHQPAETLLWKDGYWEQITFIRDDISEILASSYEEYQSIQANLKAISSHKSKSVDLPVYKVNLSDGTSFILRNNFCDWKISVNSPRDVEADFMGLFDTKAEISSCYCEGFPRSKVFGPYASNKRQFTFSVSDNYRLFMFFWIFSRQVLGNKNRREQ